MSNVENNIETGTALGVMHVMDRTGHSSISWDPAKPIEIEVAKASFDKLTKEGYRAFEVDEDDERGAPITKFNPQAGKILMVPHLVGG